MGTNEIMYYHFLKMFIDSKNINQLLVIINIFTETVKEKPESTRARINVMYERSQKLCGVYPFGKKIRRVIKISKKNNDL